MASAASSVQARQSGRSISPNNMAAACASGPPLEVFICKHAPVMIKEKHEILTVRAMDLRQMETLKELGGVFNNQHAKAAAAGDCPIDFKECIGCEQERNGQYYNPAEQYHAKAESKVNEIKWKDFFKISEYRQKGSSGV
jgi:hypothetical protein